jgi:hypothetical protein
LSDYVLREFTPVRLAEVAADWKKRAGEDEFAVEMATVFEWAETHLVHMEGDAYALELVHPVKLTAGAILEIVDARRGSMTKLLKLYVSPEFWAARDTVSRSELVDMHASAYTEVIRMGMDNGVESVKIYGRTEMMHDILVDLQNLWPVVNSGTTATMEGRWLRIARDN